MHTTCTNMGPERGNRPKYLHLMHCTDFLTSNLYCISSNQNSACDLAGFAVFVKELDCRNTTSGDIKLLHLQLNFPLQCAYWLSVSCCYRIALPAQPIREASLPRTEPRHTFVTPIPLSLCNSISLGGHLSPKGSYNRHCVSECLLGHGGGPSSNPTPNPALDNAILHKLQYMAP